MAGSSLHSVCVSFPHMFHPFCPVLHHVILPARASALYLTFSLSTAVDVRNPHRLTSLDCFYHWYFLLLLSDSLSGLPFLSLVFGLSFFCSAGIEPRVFCMLGKLFTTELCTDMFNHYHSHFCNIFTPHPKYPFLVAVSSYSSQILNLRQLLVYFWYLDIYLVWTCNASRLCLTGFIHVVLCIIIYFILFYC
jgi:hypothetical protein